MRNNIFTKVCFITLAAFISTGCAARYGCKAPEGKSCSSITDVYTDSLSGEKVDKAKVKVELEENSSEENEPLQESDHKPEPVKSVILPSPQILTGTPVISAPKVLRIWVAPWEDDDGDLHEPGYIFLQVDKGKWVY